MYCKSCGVNNSNSSNYCKHDGTPLGNSVVKFKKKEKPSTFCSTCGNKTNEASSNYCNNCGNTFFQYSNDGTSTATIINSLVDKSPTIPRQWPKFQTSHLKSAILPGLLSVIIVLLLSVVLLNGVDKQVNEIFSETMNDEFDLENIISYYEEVTDTNLPKPGKLIDTFDMAMMSNLQSPDLTVTASSDLFGDEEKHTIEGETSLSLLLYILVPFIGLFLAGIFSTIYNKNRGSSPSLLTSSIGIALIYAIFFSFLSLFAGFDYDVKLREEDFNVLLDVETHYSFFGTFFSTFIIGFLFSGFGLLFSIDYRRITNHLSSMNEIGAGIHHGIATLVRGLLLVSVSFYIYFLSKLDDLRNSLAVEFLPFDSLVEKSQLIIMSFSLQLGSIVWNLIHFGTLSLEVSEDNDASELTYSIFSGVNSEGAGGDLFASEMLLNSSDFEMYAKFGLLIPIALFIWAGFRIARFQNQLMNLVAFSVVYSLLLTMITAATNWSFSMTMDLEENFFAFGFGLTGVFIRSLLLSFVFAYLGTWIRKYRSQ